MMLNWKIQNKAMTHGHLVFKTSKLSISISYNFCRVIFVQLFSNFDICNAFTFSWNSDFREKCRLCVYTMYILLLRVIVLY